MQTRSHFFKSFFTSITWWLGFVISLILFQLAAQLSEEKNKVRFDFQTNIARLAIEARIQSHIEVLRATRAMFHASGKITRKAFHAYVTDLDLYTGFPGITNLNFATHVADRDKAAFESSVRRDRSIEPDGRAEFAIKPPGTRSEYHALTYLAPLLGNEDSLGFDLASAPYAEEAVALARDSDELISLVRPTMTGDQDEIVELEMRMPLYRQGLPLATVAQRRAAYYGSVGAGFDIEKLLLGTIDQSALPNLRLKLYQLGRNETNVRQGTSYPQYLLFDNMAKPEQDSTNSVLEPANEIFLTKSLMPVGSHVWEIEFSARKDQMLQGVAAYIPWLTLVAGMLGSLLVYANYHSLFTAQSRAVEIARDMTKDLRASKADLAEAQHMAMLGSWLLDPDDGSMTWSDETYSIFGMTHFGHDQDFADFLIRVDGQDRHRIKDALETSVRTGAEFSTEHRITRPDGSLRWVQIITRSTFNGQRRLLRGTIMDITERKHNLEALKRSQELLRELTAHQDRIKEDERKRIAREIHDELGQTLLALRLDVSMLDVRTAKSHPRFNQRVRGMLQHIDSTVKTVRTIINNLRPAVLDLGLSAAVEWQVAEFRRRSGIDCELVLDAQEFELSDARATTLFRIVQESLSNVIRHANATHVRIEIYEKGNKLVMNIADNGIGIDPAHRNKSDSFGLVGIEERVLALDGEFRIDTAPGNGTLLTIFIPLDPADSDHAHLIDAQV